MSELELDQFKDRCFMAGTIERFEEKMAVIKLADGQQLLWPIKDLPDELNQGDWVRIVLSTAKTDQEERQKISKTILNEILKNSDQKDD